MGGCVGVWAVEADEEDDDKNKGRQAGRQAGRYAGKQACMQERTGKTEQQANGRDHCSPVIAVWF